MAASIWQGAPRSAGLPQTTTHDVMGLLLGLALVANTGCGRTPTVQAATLIASPVFNSYRLNGSVKPVRDPSMIRQGNTYYLFSTDDGAPAGGSIKIRCSSDLNIWTDCGDVFPGIPEWVSEQVPGVVGLWAPDISYFNHAYHLYYVGSIFGTNKSVIGLATNLTLDPKDPSYAWIDQGEVLSSERGDDFNALDPNVFIDSDDTIWLSYGSFWTGIKQAAIDPTTGKLLTGASEVISLAARPDSSPHAIEAPFLVHRGTYYYLFASFGLCCTANPYQSDYRIMVGRGPSAHGPFVDQNGVPMLQGGGTELITGSGSGWNAPGGQSIFLDPESGASTIVFHAHSLPTGTPYLFVNSLSWENDWPQIVP